MLDQALHRMNGFRMIDPCEFANPQLRDLVPYEPGKPIDDVARELGLEPENIVKLASNENPLGPSPKAIQVMQSLAGEVHVYPDGGGWKLRNAIAEKFSLSMDNIILGNGSNEIIEFLGHSLLKPGDEVIVANHAFVVYKLMATLFGAKTIEVNDPGFVHDLEAMADAINEKTKQIFIANPNNPTGTLVTQEAIDRFMERVPENIIVIFDEAYYEFLDTPPDTLKFIKEGRNVVVMRTFSKIQGLAGLRIGYGITTPSLSSILQKTRQPFNANLIAQEAALAALDDDEHQNKTKKITDEGRSLFQSEFEKMGIEYVPSYANFVLLKVGDGDEVFQKMLSEGVIVRAMRGYKLPEWIRVSIGTMEENLKFLELLRLINS